MDTGIWASIVGFVILLAGGLFAALRSNGKKDAQIEEQLRKAQQSAEHLRTLDNAIQARSRIDEKSRTDPIADIDAAPSMRDRKRD